MSIKWEDVAHTLYPRISEIDSRNLESQLSYAERKMRENTIVENISDKELKTVDLWYLQDRRFGERWDGSTSHKIQKPKQNQTVTVTVARKHTVEVRGLVIFRRKFPGIRRLAERSWHRYWPSELSRGTSCRRLQSPAPAAYSVKFSSIGPSSRSISLKRIRGTNQIPGRDRVTHHFAISCNWDFPARGKEDARVSLRIRNTLKSVAR